MEKTMGAFTVSVFPQKQIVKSVANGATTVQEVEWLINTLKEIALQNDWKNWAYLANIEYLPTVTAAVCREFIKLHHVLSVFGCTAIAFVENESSLVATQAKIHSRMSMISTQERHFLSESAAIKWLEDQLALSESHI